MPGNVDEISEVLAGGINSGVGVVSEVLAGNVDEISKVLT
jgi:hypothetical protein